MLPDNAGDAADARENTHRSRQPTSLTDGAFAYSTEGGDELLAPALTCEPVKAAAIDVREFIRFFLSGVTATVGNMAAVWLTRRFLPFETALLAGIAAGITISFALSKIFAFRSRPWNRAVGEAAEILDRLCSGLLNLLGAGNLC